MAICPCCGHEWKLSDDKKRETNTAWARNKRETDPAFRERQNERNRVYGARRWLNPVERQKAQVRQRTRLAIKKGRIERRNCVVCGATEAVPHHPDYSRSFFFVWLCREHHELVHRLARAGDVEGVVAIERHATETLPIDRRKVRKTA